MRMPEASPGESVLATILKHDSKTTSYKMALLRALNDVVVAYPDVAAQHADVAVPLRRLAELWIAYYWPFMDPDQPIYQGARARRGDTVRNDVSFRPALAALRTAWAAAGQLAHQPSDGFFLLTDMHTPRRRATYAPALVHAYDQAVTAAAAAVKMPIQFAGAGQWTVFAKPSPMRSMPPAVRLLPGSAPQDVCVVISAELWRTFHRLSLYIEALCLHEWSLFTERVTQAEGLTITRGQAYALLTARPDNRRPLLWERNQVDLLLLEQVPFACPWTGKRLTEPHHYDLDHLLPLALYPINELWNLLPVDKAYNQHVKRDRVPDAGKLQTAQPYVAAAYAAYERSAPLRHAVREDAALRFTHLPTDSSFANALAQQALAFIDRVATARFATRY